MEKDKKKKICKSYIFVCSLKNAKLFMFIVIYIGHENCQGNKYNDTYFCARIQ